VGPDEYREVVKHWPVVEISQDRTLLKQTPGTLSN